MVAWRLQLVPSRGGVELGSGTVLQLALPKQKSKVQRLVVIPRLLLPAQASCHLRVCDYGSTHRAVAARVEAKVRGDWARLPWLSTDGQTTILVVTVFLTLTRLRTLRSRRNVWHCTSETNAATRRGASTASGRKTPPSSLATARGDPSVAPRTRTAAACSSSSCVQRGSPTFSSRRAVSPRWMVFLLVALGSPLLTTGITAAPASVSLPVGAASSPAAQVGATGTSFGGHHRRDGPWADASSHSLHWRNLWHGVGPQHWSKDFTLEGVGAAAAIPADWQQWPQEAGNSLRPHHRGLQLGGTVHVAPNGTNSPTCGGVDDPCATVPFAVNGIGSGVPVSSLLHVHIHTGSYDSSSCGSVGLRPLNITGDGPRSTVVDCEGRTRFLTATASTFVSGLTITRGFAPVLARASGGVSVDGGGAIAVFWSGAASDATATFSDLVFMHNVVVGQADFTNVSVGLVGGGALLVAGSNRAGGAAVTVTDSVFVNNSATLVDLTPEDHIKPVDDSGRPDRGMNNSKCHAVSSVLQSEFAVSSAT
jgi:hypothetical protein